MYKPNEIFARMPEGVATAIFSFLQEKEKGLYKATVETLATQRKLRPVFVERKPKPDRYLWLKDALGRRSSEATAAHLLQIWLVAEHKQVLGDFLDALGIKHDQGAIDQLPPAPPKEELSKAVDLLLSKHDAGVVMVYLHAFQALDDEGWNTLEELLAEDPRLTL